MRSQTTVLLAAFASLQSLIPIAVAASTEEGGRLKPEDFNEIKITWHDDTSHPRRLQTEPVDYIEKTRALADQFAALIGGLDGAIDVATIIHDEVEEILGQATPEKLKKDKEREERLKKFLPLFDPMTAMSGKASEEQYVFDLGDGTEKQHTAQDMFFDAFSMFVDYLRSNESRSRPSMARLFDDEL